MDLVAKQLSSTWVNDQTSGKMHCWEGDLTNTRSGPLLWPKRGRHWGQNFERFALICCEDMLFKECWGHSGSTHDVSDSTSKYLEFPKKVDGYPPWSFTVRPWKVTKLPLGKACLPFPPFFKGLGLVSRRVYGIPQSNHPRGWECHHHHLWTLGV